MPMAIPAIVAAAAAYGGGIIVGYTIAQAAMLAAIAFASTMVMGMLSTTPKTPDLSFSSASSAQKRIQQFREATSPHVLVYGECRLSGPMLFATSTSDGKYLHLVIALAAHEVEAIDEVFMDNYPIYSDMLDGSGVVNTGKFNGKIRIKKHLGAPGQTADSDLVSEITDWTTDFKGTSRAYIYVRLEFDSELFSGIPAISAWVRGKKVVDPRESGDPSVWTPNSVLCIRDFLLDSDHGIGGLSEDVNDDTTIASANICEEFVAVDNITHNVLSVDATNNFIRLKNYNTSAADNVAIMMFQTGDRVTVTSDGTYIGNIEADTNYYAVPRHRWATDDSYVELQLATSYDNALSHTTIDFTSAGSGTMTVIKNAEPRYTCNGPISCDRQWGDILTDMTTSFAGSIVHIGDSWHIRVGAYVSPTFVFDEGDARGSIKIETKRPRQDRFNRVKGSYASPINYGVVTTYPIVVNSLYLSEDNNVKSWHTYDQAFTSRPGQAQRTAKILLERHRQQITITYPISLIGLKVQCGDTVMINNTRFGWTNKVFEVIGWTLGITPQKQNQTASTADQGIMVNLTLQETASTVYDWNSGEETLVDPAPNTSLPSPLSVVAPTNLVLTSGTDELFTKDDGTIVSRLHGSWTASTDPYLDHYEVQVKKDSASDWSPAGTIDRTLTELWTFDVKDGIAYSERVRAVNHLGRASTWLTVTGHVVVGKTAPPSDVTTFTANQNGNAVNFRWSQIPDADLAGYEIRYMAAPFVYADAAELTKVTRGTRITTAAVQPSPVVDGVQVPWVFGIKAEDTSKNQSVNALTTDLIVTNAFTVVSSNEQWPLWTGTLDGFIRNPLTGKLNPASQVTAADVDWTTFSGYVPSPVDTSTYTTNDINLGQDTSARIWTAANVNLGPGEIGSANPLLEIDYYAYGGAYDGFEVWNVGDAVVDTLKGRITIDNTTGPSRVTRFNVTVDSQSRKESGTVVITGSPAGQEAVVFSTPFTNVPDVRTFNADAAPGIVGWDNVTTTGFTALRWDTSGAAENGTVAWDAEGV